MPTVNRPGFHKTETAILRVRLLGHMDVISLADDSLLPNGTKTKGLLAILALSDRRPVARTRLAELLWSQRSTEQARASLRQEIHRLQDALNPLGVSVLDVQRQSLALLPGLTSVDAERFLTCTPGNVLNLPDAPSPLLENLSTVDPAFTLWLADQRTRMRQHVLHQLEALLVTTPDPTTARDAARRLLRMEPLHEAAWRTRILSETLCGEQGTALLSAETCIRAFQDAVGAPPGEETMRLISEIRSTRYKTVTPLAAPGERRLPIWASRSPVEPEAIPAPRQPLYGNTHISTLVFFSCPDSITDPAVISLAEDFRDELCLSMVRHGILDVIMLPQRFPSTTPEDLDVFQQKGTDFILSVTLTSQQDGKAHLTLQAFDTRLNGAIVWGYRLAFTQENLNSLSNRISSVLVWTLLLTESRRLGSKPLAELAPIGMALRAFNLSQRHDPTISGVIEDLLHRAETRAPEEAFILYVHGNYLLLSAFEQWDAPIASLMAPVVELMRKTLTLMPTSINARYLLTVGLLYTQRRDEAFALLQQIKTELDDPQDSLFILLKGFYALTGGELVPAAQIYMDFFNMVPFMPITITADHNLIVSCFLAGQHEMALEKARNMLITNPNRTAILLPALAAACVLGQHALADEYAERLNLLQPELTASRIEAHYTYLQPQHLKLLTDALKKGGFLESGPAPLRPLSAESASRRLAGLPRQDMKGAKTHPTMSRT
ncbi:AfsR/SARP family transcriptional regulator [Acetobacter orleanensis]|uniref:Transcriptional activator n=1 Tax=Acetobacter orleanensis TaxID=104099 RepID=A0A4Y3TQC1_9PROT|nr:BTAD domain-containing putative transcriptional regulator [Acetobacter orleanensis]KXV62666.1 hypothetical protein AD949_09310 [Acetobacter orleanensis]PCD79178.1 hypothetical protein CO710_07810 [Acetobacter orleanensis]GAN68636.1 hypothetical protein Abol_020_079 [Acetobacter orleanensis JCM 7639]GBR27798.1 SARP family transcriptional regulator [Acetobacter orleanensis NRIC 0473]GEB83267.1 transcriptional activator [Acetobacter orleanensis]